MSYVTNKNLSKKQIHCSHHFWLAPYQQVIAINARHTSKTLKVFLDSILILELKNTISVFLHSDQNRVRMICNGICNF